MKHNVSIKAVKPMVTIYVAMLLPVLAFFLFNNLFAADIYDYRLRIVTVVFLACTIMIILGAEIARLLFKAGITPIGFIAFLITNLLFIELLFASFVDHMGNDLADPTGAFIVMLLLGGIVWYVIIAFVSMIEWIRDRKKPHDSQV